MFVWKPIYHRAASLEVLNKSNHFVEENGMNWGTELHCAPTVLILD
jgi:hypothetical protein